MRRALAGVAVLVVIIGWPYARTAAGEPSSVAAEPRTAGGAAAPADPFEAFLAAPFPVADGFSLPVGDPNGGSGEGQPVRAIAHGRVVEVGADVVVEHLFYENHQRRRVHSVYSKLGSISVEVGHHVLRGQQLGATGAAQPGFGLRGDDPNLDAAEFIAARASLFVPQQEPRLILAHHGLRKLRIYRHGSFVREQEIGLGQLGGPKRVRGDLRTPVGMYFVVQKSKGPFTGDYADYYGGHWIKVSYPNAYDAARGLDGGMISAAQRDAIATAWQDRRLTLQDTKLGGGIGFHGWIEEWRADAGSDLSWGCVVLHNDDLPSFYEEAGLGAMVVLME